MTFLEKSRKIARWAHKEQTRKDDEPYFSHLEAVAKNTEDILFTGPFEADRYQEIMGLSYLHDVLEDQSDKINLDYLSVALKHLSDDENYNKFESGLIAITKKPKGQEEYIDYVLRVKSHPWARIVKLADLKHNMSDLGAGNLRDKYSLTKYFLEH